MPKTIVRDVQPKGMPLLTQGEIDPEDGLLIYHQTAVYPITPEGTVGPRLPMFRAFPPNDLEQAIMNRLSNIYHGKPVPDDC